MTGQLERREWPLHAKADAHINDAKGLELGRYRSFAPCAANDFADKAAIEQVISIP